MVTSTIIKITCCNNCAHHKGDIGEEDWCDINEVDVECDEYCEKYVKGEWW